MDQKFAEDEKEPVLEGLDLSIKDANKKEYPVEI